MPGVLQAVASYKIAAGSGGITAVNQLISAADTSNNTNYTTGSFTPTANALVVLCISSGQSSGQPSVSSVTTSQSDSVSSLLHQFDYVSTGSGRSSQFIYAYKASNSPASTTVTVAFANAQQGARFQFFEVIGSDVANGVSQCFVQFVDTTADTSGTSLSITLASPGNSNNRAFLFSSHTKNETMTIGGTGWADIGQAGHNAPTVTSHAAWRSDAFDTSISDSWTTNVSYGGTGFEIKSSRQLPKMGYESVWQKRNKRHKKQNPHVWKHYERP